jgi:hypothetical protein
MRECGSTVHEVGSLVDEGAELKTRCRMEHDQEPAGGVVVTSTNCTVLSITVGSYGIYISVCATRMLVVAGRSGDWVPLSGSVRRRCNAALRRRCCTYYNDRCVSLSVNSGYCTRTYNDNHSQYDYSTYLKCNTVQLRHEYEYGRYWPGIYKYSSDSSFRLLHLCKHTNSYEYVSYCTCTQYPILQLVVVCHICI